MRRSSAQTRGMIMNSLVKKKSTNTTATGIVTADAFDGGDFTGWD